MKNITLLLLLAAFVSTSLTATTTNTLGKKGKKVPGYVIMKSGDKVEGMIATGSITDNEVKVTFYSRSGKKTTYKPKDILGYGYEETEEDDLGIEETNWVHYETAKVDYPPKPFGPKTVFMQREEAGSVSLYCYYVEVRNNPRKPYRYYYYLKDEQGKMSKVEKGDFKKIARSLFKDYSAMTQRIGKKDFLYRNLDRMVRDYNYWVANQHDSNEYRVAMKN